MEGWKSVIRFSVFGDQCSVICNLWEQCDPPIFEIIYR